MPHVWRRLYAMPHVWRRLYSACGFMSGLVAGALLTVHARACGRGEGRVPRGGGQRHGVVQAQAEARGVRELLRNQMQEPGCLRLEQELHDPQADDAGLQREIARLARSLPRSSSFLRWFARPGAGLGEVLRLVGVWTSCRCVQKPDQQGNGENIETKAVCHTQKHQE
eukprot:1616804-Rhodomonas_salina.1